MGFGEWQRANVQHVIWEGFRRFVDPCWFDVRVGRLRRSRTFVVYYRRDDVLVWVEPCPHPVEMVLESGSIERWIMSFLRRKDQAEAKRAMVNAALAGEWAKKHPALWEFLTCEEYPDGSPRERSMLCLFVENGVFKGALQDRDQQQSLWASGDALESVLEALEAKVASGDDCEWRAMGGVKKTGKRR